MSEIIVSKTGREGRKFRAHVDTAGAYITSCCVEMADGLPEVSLLHPAYPDGQGRRGGAFWCLPFGPESSHLDAGKHGFPRRVEWQVSDDTRFAGRVRLEAADPNNYDLQAAITYDLREDTMMADSVAPELVLPYIYRLFATLQVKNSGTESKLCAPGFHPYLPVTVDQLVGSGCLAELGLEEAKLRASEPQIRRSINLGGFTVVAAGHERRVSAVGLQKICLWAPPGGGSVCVEPMTGPLYGPGRDVRVPMLEPGQELDFVAVVEVSI